MAASTRSPCRPSGTRTVRWSATVRSRVRDTVVAFVAPVPHTLERYAANGQDRADGRRTHDRDVGDVADEEAEVVDEVDDVTATEPGLTQDPVVRLPMAPPRSRRA